MRYTLAAIIASLLLTTCGGDEQTVPEVQGARTGVFITQQLTLTALDVAVARPSAILGIYVASFLTQSPVLTQGALIGIRAQEPFFRLPDGRDDDSYILLQQIGLSLQVDIPDMLNRSENRAEMLDNYLNTLIALLEQGVTEVELLEQQEDAAQEERRERRRELNDRQRTLSQALRDDDYATAGALQQSIIDAQGSLATAEATADRLQDLLRLYEDALEVGQERVLAIRQNRRALIAGITVIDVPGADDLGVIEEGERGRRNDDFLNLDDL